MLWDFTMMYGGSFGILPDWGVPSFFFCLFGFFPSLFFPCSLSDYQNVLEDVGTDEEQRSLLRCVLFLQDYPNGKSSYRFGGRNWRQRGLRRKEKWVTKNGTYEKDIGFTGVHRVCEACNYLWSPNLWVSSNFFFKFNPERLKETLLFLSLYYYNDGISTSISKLKGLLTDLLYGQWGLVPNKLISS